MNFFDWLLHRGPHENDLDEEIQAHLRMAEAERITQGESAEDARASAAREFGNDVLVKEVTRKMWGFVWLDDFARDLQHGIRVLAKNLAFTVVAVLTLALGIGVNSTIFSVVNGILLALPLVRDPERIAVVSGGEISSGWFLGPVSTADFADWRAQNNVFEAMAASAPGADMDLSVQGAPEMVSGVPVTANYFDVLGVKPALGRNFTTGEDQGGRAQEVILSDGLWRDHFGADPGILGSVIKINGKQFTVIGAMPSEYKFWLTPAQLWIPMTEPPARDSRSLKVLARLKPGVSPGQASAEMATISGRLARQYPATNKEWTARATTLPKFRSMQAKGAKQVLAILMGAVGLVLLIACTNVAGLLLAKGASRRKELAIRSSLGASRGRMMRQLLAETMPLGAMGGGFGLLFARWGIQLLHSLMNFNQAMGAIPLEIDGNVLEFTMGISFLAVAVCGLIPAIQTSRANPETALKGGSRTGAAIFHNGPRRILVIAEIAMAVIMLAGASILIRALVDEFNADLGFDSHEIWSIGVSLPADQNKSPAQEVAFLNLITDRIGGLPEISSVAVTNGLPMAGANSVPFSIGSDLPQKDDKSPRASFYDVSHDYFKTMAIPLLRGRAFTDADNSNSPAVVMINDELSKMCFRDQNPVGRFITLGEGSFVSLGGVQARTSGLARRRQIVGVVGSVKDWLGQEGFQPQVYIPLEQSQLMDAIVVLRWNGQGAPSAAAIGKAIWSAGSDEVTVGSLESMGETIDKLGGGGPKLIGKLMGTFAVLALLLAAIGVYGVVAYVVALRTHEIGVRLALGASRSNVFRLVLREIFLVSLTGMLLGIAASAPLPRLLRAEFWNIGTNQIPLLSAVSVTILVVVLLASFIPARRATKVDPMVALRCE